MPIEQSSLIFTVDVEGDWAGDETRGIREALPRLLDLLDRYQASATFFVVADLADLVHPILTHDSPHEVGSHSLSHRVLTSLPHDELVEEVCESKRVLERAGYQVDGFRAPFFAAPAELPAVVAAAGYAYDASIGAVNPGFAARRVARSLTIDGPSVPRVATSLLSDGWSPFSLTWLRLYHPWGVNLVPATNTRLFYCHLHELLENTSGWTRLPFPVRQLHRRASGETAWRIVERLLAAARGRTVTCREAVARRPVALTTAQP